jgi:hypothetical protein
LLRPRDLASPTLSLFAGASTLLWFARLRRLSAAILALSTLLWAVGFFFAFLAGPLLF